MKSFIKRAHTRGASRHQTFDKLAVLLMPWTWPQLDSNFRRKQISGHYSKVRHISKPISSWFFVTDVEQNLQETGDGAIPEITPIHFNYAQQSHVSKASHLQSFKI